MVILSVSERIFVDVGVIKPHLLVFYASERITNLPSPCTQSLDFGSMENNPSLESFKDMVIPPRFGVGDNLCL